MPVLRLTPRNLPWCQNSRGDPLQNYTTRGQLIHQLPWRSKTGSQKEQLKKRVKFALHINQSPKTACSAVSLGDNPNC